MSNLFDSLPEAAEKFVDSNQRTNQRERQAWLSALAKAPPSELLPLWGQLKAPDAVTLRPPETGMVMVRGRTGGSGDPFNLGEMTVTRCAVRLNSGETGIGYVSSRDKGHAYAAAVVDAMMQSAVFRPEAESLVIAPLQAAARVRAEKNSRKASATQVEFFTMVRDRKA